MIHFRKKDSFPCENIYVNFFPDLLVVELNPVDDLHLLEECGLAGLASAKQEELHLGSKIQIRICNVFLIYFYGNLIVVLSSPAAASSFGPAAARGRSSGFAP